LLFLLACTATCSVWWIRNCVALESFRPLGTKGSVTLLGGYCDESYVHGGEWRSTSEVELRNEVHANTDWDTISTREMIQAELKIEQLARLRLGSWVAANYSSMPALIWKRIVTEWNPYVGKALIMKLFALVGIVWLACRNREVLFWLAGPLLINTLIVALTYSVGGRFLIPTVGPFYILAAIGFSGPICDMLIWQKMAPI